MKKYALGMIETIGLTTLISALDAAVKAADVQVLKYEKAEAGIVTGYLIGNVASVKAAVESGVRLAKQLGGYRSSKIIAKPDDSIISILIPERDEKRDLLQAMTIKELQKVAKEMSGFPLAGRSLHRLKKAEIIDILLELGGDKE